MVLVQSEVIAVQAKINVETAVAIVVGDGGMGESSLRRSRKFEGVAFQYKLPIALVQKEQRAAGAHDQQILQPLVLEIGKQGAGGAVEHAHPSCSVTSSRLPSP